MKARAILIGASVLVASLAGCAQPARKAAQDSDATLLNAIISDYTEASKHLDPYWATYFNVEEELDQFGDYPSPEYYARGKALVARAVERLKAVRSENLNAKDFMTYRLFKGDVEIALRGYDFPGEFFEFNQMGNRLHSYLDDSSEQLTSFPFDSVKHYDAFIKRSEGFPLYVDRQIDLLRRGVQKKLVLSCAVASAVVNTYRDGLEGVVEKNPFYRPVLFMPKSFPESDRKRLADGFSRMIQERIVPGFKKFDRFYRKEYVPHCRSGFGLNNLPNGKKWYAYSIEASTGLKLAPDDIHRRGLKEMDRIAGELRKLQATLGFHGTLQQFLHSLTQDPKYFFTSSRELFEAFKAVKAKTAQHIPDFFSLVPKHDYEIVESSNPEDAAGSYNSPTEMIDHGRFVVNTKNLRAVPRYEVTTLSLHESMPGHHFQFALQFEMQDKLSEYQRKIYSSNAFAEGWALYSEFLGNEMGMYSDPMQRLGNLNDEMLRAVRLVVDTGIHEYGWSRKKTIRFMTEHLASDAKDILNEADRYSVWPGQALGYKIGQMKIIELRRLAELELGPRFDIKEFHRVVLGSGTVSLPVLETQVRDWITSVRAASTAAR